MADNVFDEDDQPSGSNAVKKDELLGYVERIERLKDEQAVIAETIKEVRTEAKSKGYDSKALAAILSLRKKDQNTLDIIGHYADVLGVFG